MSQPHRTPQREENSVKSPGKSNFYMFKIVKILFYKISDGFFNVQNLKTLR